MPIKTIQHNGIDYPAFQSEGNAAQFCRPFAQKVCKGVGVDVGCNRKEWAYVDADGVEALCIDPVICSEYHALNFPNINYDYVISSHCGEHLDNWVDAFDYWIGKLKVGGVLFLYLPDYSQTYWRVFSNRKHIHTFFPQLVRDYLEDRKMKNIFVSGVDLNNSFMAMCEK